MAAAHAHPEAIRCLLACGNSGNSGGGGGGGGGAAAPDPSPDQDSGKDTPLFNTPDYTGVTPLYAALVALRDATNPQVFSRAEAAVMLLLQAGADVNTADMNKSEEEKEKRKKKKNKN